MHVRCCTRVLVMPAALVAMLVLSFVGCTLLELPPTADFKVTPSSTVSVGTEVTLDGSSSSDPQSYELRFEWSVTPPSGSTAKLSATDEPIVTFTPSAAGEYTVLLQVTSTSGSRKSDQRSKTITVTAPQMTDEDTVAADKAALSIGYAAGDSAGSVTQDLDLPPTGPYGSSVSWASDRPAIIAPTGSVVRPPQDTAVVLTATLTKGSVNDTKSFTLTVIASGFVDPIIGDWTLSVVGTSEVTVPAAEANVAENISVLADGSWTEIAVFDGEAQTAGGTWSAQGGGSYLVYFTSGGPEGVASAEFTLDSANMTLTATVDGQYIGFTPGHVVLPPTGLTAIDVSSSSAPAISLSWTPSLSDEVTQYEVWRGTESGNQPTLVGTTDYATTSLLDDSLVLEWDTDYYYVVTSLAGGTESPVTSNEVAITTITTPVETGVIDVTID